MENNKFGIASFVCGLVGLLIIWIPFLGLLGFILSILSIIFYSKQKKISNSGLATAGFVLGIIGTIIGCLFLIVSCSVIIMAWGTTFSKSMAMA